MDPLKSEVIKTAVATGWWAEATTTLFEAPLPNTFRRQGVHANMTGYGTSRIDSFLLNRPAMQALRSFGMSMR